MDNLSDFVKIHDVYDKIKKSEDYTKLTKREQRNMNKQKLIQMFKENDLFKDSYLERWQSRNKNGGRTEYTNVLLGYMLKSRWLLLWLIISLTNYIKFNSYLYKSCKISISITNKILILFYK